MSSIATPTASRTATFADYGVPAPLVTVLDEQGFTTPFPIQADTLPESLAGRDVLGRGRTGSGKTLAFALPLVARLAPARPEAVARRGRAPRGLVLAPTRELATQIDAVIAPLARAYGLSTTTVFGGVNQNRQAAALRAGVDIVTACPGRLEDLIGQGIISLADIEITVIDEADLMADFGFLPAVTRILSATPPRGQRLLFSATLDNGVDKLVKRFLHDPRMHSVDEVATAIPTMTHHVFEVADAEEKKAVVQTLASGTTRRLLFTRTKHQAKRLAKQLSAAGIPAVEMQGNLSQNARDRNLARFQSGEVRVMVATDVAARGIDIDDVELVVHVDPPTEHKTYIHRSGRTARAGHVGEIVTVCLPEERRDLSAVLRQAKIGVRPVRVRADSPEVTRVVGEVAPYVKPEPVAAQPAQPRRRREGGQGSQHSGQRGPQSGQSQRAGGQAPSPRGESGNDGSRRGRAAQGGQRRREHSRSSYSSRFRG